MSSLETKLLSSVRKLPKNAVLQVIDFADYLNTRYSSSNMEYSQAISRGEASHLEEEFEDYKKRFPRE